MLAAKAVDAEERPKLNTVVHFVYKHKLQASSAVRCELLRQ